MSNAATSEMLRQHAATTLVQKVVIVNGSPKTLELLQSILEAGHYDLVFVESAEHAYSQIKRVQPDLVILCARMDNADAFQVLSMLRLDEDTRDVPVLTYTCDDDEEESDEALGEPSELEMFPALKAAAWMN